MFRKKVMVLIAAAGLLLITACSPNGRSPGGGELPKVRDMSSEPYLCDLVDVTVPEGYAFDYEIEYVDEDQAPLSEAHWLKGDVDLCLQAIQKAPDAAVPSEPYGNDSDAVREKHFYMAGYQMSLFMSKEDRSKLDEADRKAFDDFYSGLKEKDAGLSDEHEEMNSMAGIESPDGFFPTTITWGRNKDGSLRVMKEWLNDKDAALELYYQWKAEIEPAEEGLVTKSISVDGKDYELRMYPLHYGNSDETENAELSEENRQAFEAVCESIK